MPIGDRVVLARTLYTVKDDQLAQMGPRVERAMQDALYKLGRETRDLARRLCPKKTGALMASIYVTRPGEAGGRGRSPFTRQTTAGYFRAINAAVRRNPERLTLSPLAESVHRKTQRPTKAAVSEGLFSPSIERIKGAGYKTYAAETDGDVHVVQSVMEMGGAGRSSFFVTVGAGAYYAGYVEFGHVGHGGSWVEAHPFMTPALDWAKSRLPEVAKRAMEEGVRR